MKPFFVNEAFDKAIDNYLRSKDRPESILYNSFLVVVIRMLINIYGELDILNPYRTNNEEALNNNLVKYGASLEQIDNLKRLIDGYYRTEEHNAKVIAKEKNIYFVEVQKIVIDLFNLKRLNFGTTETDSKEFFDLLYTPGTSNALRLSYNFKEAENIYEIAEYYTKAMKEEAPEDNETKKDLLGFDIYKMFNYSIADLSKMNGNEIDELNKEIYTSLDIKENAINKDYLLNKKIAEIKMQKNLITSGNGYVDILLIMSIIVTVIMVVIIFSTLFF